MKKTNDNGISGGSITAEKTLFLSYDVMYVVCTSLPVRRKDPYTRIHTNAIRKTRDGQEEKGTLFFSPSIVEEF